MSHVPFTEPVMRRMLASRRAVGAVGAGCAIAAAATSKSRQVLMSHQDGTGVIRSAGPHPPSKGPSGARCGYAFDSGWNIAIASISTSNSGRQRIAWIPVEAGSGSSPCSP